MSLGSVFSYVDGAERLYPSGDAERICKTETDVGINTTVT